MSSRPSPSRSPVVTPFQRPTTRSSPHSVLASRRRPWSFKNNLSDPHSGARIKSGQPSPFTSEHTAADIRQTRGNRLVLISSGTNGPLHVGNDRDLAGFGSPPGTHRPAADESRSHTPATS